MARKRTTRYFLRQAARTEQQNLSAHIYQDKVSSRLYSFLEKRGLAKIEMSGKWQGWFRFEEKAAHLYMSLLAKYLAELDYDLGAALLGRHASPFNQPEMRAFAGAIRCRHQGRHVSISVMTLVLALIFLLEMKLPVMIQVAAGL
jgi:hypothetical protein